MYPALLKSIYQYGQDNSISYISQLVGPEKEKEQNKEMTINTTSRIVL
jgi:hypothetical protein